MPTLPRRLNFAKGAGEGPLSEHPKARNECQTALTLKARTRSRCTTILKRTASFHAATTGLIARAVTKGGERRCTFNPHENGNLSSIRDLPESPRQTGPPDMDVPASAAGAGLTTFLATVSVCPSTRAILSSADHAFGLHKSRNPLMALTPCASVLAMYSGMIGGYRDPTESGFVSNPDSGDSQSRRRGFQSQSGWLWLAERWRSCIDWLPIPNQVTSHEDDQSIQGRVSPWLTMFQIFVIILLSIMLYRNMEIAFDL